MKIMSRPADNDFDAFRIAQAMEDAGVEVFSITHNGMHQPDGALAPSSKMIVWGKAKDDAMILNADVFIAAEFDK